MGSVYSTPISSNKRREVVLALCAGGIGLASFGALASGGTLFGGVQVERTAYKASMEVFDQDDAIVASKNEINPPKLYNISFKMSNTAIDVLLTKDHGSIGLEPPYLIAKHGDDCTETFLYPYAAKMTASEHTFFNIRKEVRLDPQRRNNTYYYLSYLGYHINCYKPPGLLCRGRH